MGKKLQDKISDTREERRRLRRATVEDSGTKTCWLDRQQHDRYWDNSADFVSGSLPSVDLRDLTHAERAESLVIRSSSPLYPGSHWTVNQYGLSPNAGRWPGPIYQAPDSSLQPWAQTNHHGRARAATIDGAKNRARHPRKWRDTGYVRGQDCQNTQLNPEGRPLRHQPSKV